MRTYYPSDKTLGCNWSENRGDQAHLFIESAIRYLFTSTIKPVLFIESAWQTNGETFAFKREPIYREAANNAGCVVITTAHEGIGGRTHMLFLATDSGLRPADCIAMV